MEGNAEFDNVVPKEDFATKSEEVEQNDWKKELKKTACKIGWRYVVFALAVIVSQYIFVFGTMLIDKIIHTDFASQAWVSFLTIIIPTYCIGFPILYLLVRKMPKEDIVKKKMGFGKIIVAILICCGICGVGSVIGTIVSQLITLPFGSNANDSNALGNLMMQSNLFWRILTVGILAPIFEEFIFRKFLIDRVIKYGEFVAIMLSGFMFGLFHGNFSQFFFATGIGMLFAFVYIRTGRVWYTILLHMIINLSSSVITTTLSILLLDKSDILNIIVELSANPENSDELMSYMNQPEVISAVIMMFAFLAWIFFIVCCALAGTVLFFVFRKKFRLNPVPFGVKKSTAFGKCFFNWGMILFGLTCGYLFVNYYLSIILASF